MARFNSTAVTFWSRRPPALEYTVAYYAGLRRSEVAKLTWGNVDIDRKLITVSDGKAKERIDLVPIHSELARELA